MKHLTWVVCGALVVSGCEAPSSSKRTIVLGGVLDRTGINSELSWGDAVLLAQAHMNLALAEAGLADLAFKFLIRDSAGLADAAIQESLQLVNTERAKGLIVASSEEDVAVNRTFYDTDVSNDLGVPLVCGSCTSSSINSATATSTDLVQQATWRNEQKWNFRATMSSKPIAKVLAGLILEAGDLNGDGKLKVSAYYVNDSFGTAAKRDLDTEMKAQLPTTGLSVPYVFEEVQHPREVDTNSYGWASDVSKLVDTFNETTQMTDGAPDYVVSANLVLQEAAFTRAYRQSGTTIRNLHFHTMRASSALRAASGLAEGELGVSHVLRDASESGEIFKTEYEAAFGTPIVYRDSIYYDAAVLLMLGSLHAALGLDDPTQVTGPQIRDALVTLAGQHDGLVVRPGKNGLRAAITALQARQAINYEGASGPMDQDTGFNVRDNLARYRVKDGVFVDEAIYGCVASANCPLTQ